MAPKAKNQKMSLGAFMTDESLGSWADEMEDMPLPSAESRTGYGERRAFSSAAGFGAPAGERGGYAVREELPLPTKPPYTAHLGNLAFDVTQIDVENFFDGCSVTSVRIVEDKLDHKPKGFGYVEFGSLDGLKKALDFSGQQLQGRNVRVSVAEPPKERQDTRDLSDWSRKGPLPDLPSQRRVSDRGGFGRNFDNMSDAGSERAERRRPAFEQGDGKIRDFGNWERKGPLSPVTTAPALSLREGGRQRSNGPGEFRKNSPSWGEGRSQDGSRPPKREYEKPLAERAPPSAAEMDNQWRSKMRPDAPAKSPTPEPSNPSSPAARSTHSERPRLNLQKRTVSDDHAPSPASSASADVKSSPFGAARPIDTAARERQIEERREKEARLKKEAETKAREEAKAAKKSTDEASKSEKGDAAQETVASPPNGNKEDIESPQGGKNFEILQREGDAEENEEEVISEDKVVKPKDIVRDAPPSRVNGAWRRGPENKDPATTQNTTKAPDEEGWSTVSKPQKGRRSNHGSRAIAS
ncbi:MAG: hypothetical protein M1834_008981 [Cirrosporium novae-zelandiae]|nr:MAG: hypothetical protein M1834_008981 [Cirrosporium novae-zelandiae]